MDASSVGVLQDLCAQKGIETTGEESFTDLMDMLRDAVPTTKPKAADLRAGAKGALDSKVANKRTGAPQSVKSHEDGDKEDDDADFDAFFKAERPGLVASGYPDDDELLLEEIRTRYKFYKSKSPTKPAAAADKSTGETGGKEVFLPTKVPEDYAASNGMTFVRKTDGVNPFVYFVTSGKGKGKVAASKKVAVPKKDAVAPPPGSKQYLKSTGAKTESAQTADKKASGLAGVKRSRASEMSPESEDEEMSVNMVHKVQMRIMKKLSVETVKINLKEMGWSNTKGGMGKLAQELAMNLVYDTEDEEE